MGGKKKPKQVQQQSQKQLAQKTPTPSKQPEEEKRFVNLLHIYTIYKQKLRRINKEEFEELLCHGCKGKRAAIELCKEFMKAKQIPDIVSFEKNVGFLSVPRFLPLIALLAERADFKLRPSLVSGVDFSQTPNRFLEKFAQLLVYGFWFLGRVISDSLSVKEQVNRGNVFNFVKGDLGFWWAGVKILDWIVYVRKENCPINCCSFAVRDPPKYRLNSSRAIFNMHQHPMYFLSEEDWKNYTATVKSVRHHKVKDIISIFKGDESLSTSTNYSYEEASGDGSSYVWSSESDVSSFFGSESEASINTLASRESVD